MNPIDIDCIGKTDFTKGFQSYYVKWPCKNIAKPKSSPIFETTIGHDEQKKSFSWSLMFGDGLTAGNTLIGLRLITTDVMVPVIYRISLSPIGGLPLLNFCSFNVFGRNDNMAWGVQFSPDQIAKFNENNDDLIVHFWIDIPLSIVSNPNFKKRKFEAIVGNEDSTNEPIANLSRLLKSVLNGDKNSDTYNDSDITLEIIEEKKTVRQFRCHRNILKTSFVFQRMLAGELKENGAAIKKKFKNGKEENILEIVDIDEKTMEILLRFIYTGQLPDSSIDMVLASKIIYAADKYNLIRLKNWCTFLSIGQGQSQIFRSGQLLLADRHRLDQLKAVCISQLSMNILNEYDKVETSLHGNTALMHDIIKSCSERQYKATEINLPTA